MDYVDEDKFDEADGNEDLGNAWFLRIVVRGVVKRTQICIIGYPLALLWSILFSLL